VTVQGWDEPEALTEYQERVGQAQAGRAVPWGARAKYLRETKATIDALRRSLDAAQEGVPLPATVLPLLNRQRALAASYNLLVELSRGE
jgi:hypothetical protein